MASKNIIKVKTLVLFIKMVIASTTIIKFIYVILSNKIIYIFGTIIKVKIVVMFITLILVIGTIKLKLQYYLLNLIIISEATNYVKIMVLFIKIIWNLNL